MTDRARVAAVLVSYNRRALLLEALAAVQAQDHAPDLVIVVDNGSADGSAAAVRADFPSVRLAELGANYGGAGGFAYGMREALAAGSDLIWLMDDDTVPTAGALSQLLAARSRYLGERRAQGGSAAESLAGAAGGALALVASAVVWTDGRPHPMNTPRRKPFATRAERAAAAAVGCTPIRSASFVSVLVDAQCCRERGLPRADFFLWNDDFEFTTRLLRGNAGLLCPASVVVHKTKKFGGTDADPGDRFYYEVRNKIWTLRANSLAMPERVLYAGATARRWIRTYRTARDRRTLRSALVRGLAAGLRGLPRPNDQVLPHPDQRVPGR